ncbi:MAG: SOS response-associated peptidase [Vallitaleaceae bacterium]|nr:SOS response-associated peptidase [Vallitaleaceae bacterium]
MCGRVILSFDFDTLEEMLSTNYSIPEYHINPIFPRFNITPGQGLLAIINDGKTNRAGELHWGFVPSWAEDEKIGYTLTNARSETLHEKPTFKSSFEKKRCLILANGFYEWKRDGKEKIPYRFQVGDAQLFSMAGLWTSYSRKDGTKLYSCAIVTTQANELMQPIHHRMPSILTREAENEWLDPNNKNLTSLQKLLGPYPASKMSAYKVSTLVNSGRVDSPECILPI